MIRRNNLGTWSLSVLASLAAVGSGTARGQAALPQQATPLNAATTGLGINSAVPRIGEGAGLGTGVNVNTANTGLGYGGYNTGIGYGGYGLGYGGIAVSSGYGYGNFGGYGFGGYGGVGGGYGIGDFGYVGGTLGNGINGYNGYGSYGVTAYDQAMMQNEQYSLANSRYNMQTAQANQAYAEADYYRQKALQASIDNQNLTSGLRQTYGIKSSQPRYHHAPVPANAAPVDLNSVIGENGAIRWPSIAPQNDARHLADEAIGQVASKFRNGKTPDVQSVNDARDALYAYGRPALASIRRVHASKAAEMKDFLNNLDRGLDKMAQAPPGSSPPDASDKPSETPSATEKPGP